MSNRPEHSDQHDEAQLEKLLQSGYAVPGPSAEFQEALLRQLHQTFLRTYPTEADPTKPTLPVDGSSMINGSPQHAEASTKAAASEDLAVDDDRCAVPRRRVGLRLAMTMAVAASLLFAVALWNSQTAYGWSAMLRALENCGWVQAVSETAGLSGWVSARQGVVAIRGEEDVAFYDQAEQTSLQYRASERVIYQQTLPASRSAQGAEQLFAMLLRDGREVAAGGQHDLSDYEVVSESWRRLEAGDGRSAAIELRVILRDLGSSGRIRQLLISLDPDTQLPDSCRLIGEGEDSTRTLEFSYPAEGPSSIFSLGIPRDAEVIASLSDPDAAPGGAARESEASRLLRKATDATQEQKPTLLAVKPAAENLPDVATSAPNEGKSVVKGPLEEASANTLTRKVVTEEIVTVSPPAIEPVQQSEQRVATNPPRPIRTIDTPALPEVLLAPGELIEQVNAQLAASWQSQGISPAEPASDTEFLRRAYLDLTGRIPMVYEVYDFIEDDRADRRARLVDELLASRDHATHLATVWRTLLLPDGVDTNTYGGTGKFDEWLADRFEQNVPYDQLVRELLLAEGRVSDSGPILFYAALKLNPEELAAKTARTFLGMRMECAQCHDHPFDESISQEDFWGFAAHFAQISRPRGKMDMTSSVLRVRDNSRGEVMLPDSDEVVPPRMPYAVQPTDDREGTDDSLSRRKALVDWLTTKQNSRFARATVNRAWQHLFGLGLVEPADDMRADNPATCPEVLETLSLDFAAGGYDLRRLLRALVLSDAYQLSSRGAEDEPSRGLVFARMNVKSFTADQLYDCISVATQIESAGGNATDRGLARFGNASRQAFIEQFRAPPGRRTDYHAGIPQALTLMHGYLVHGGTDLASSGLLKALNAPFMNNEQRVETLFLATLSRRPDQVEHDEMLAHVDAAENEADRSRALGDVLWALLNSAEFTFIH